jgi:glutaredoxin
MLLALPALLTCLPAQLQAQAIYKIVGPDGRVTFSDRPPEGGDKAKTLGADGRPTDDAAANALPYELRQIASRFPVTIYSGDNCQPCASGRSLLASRGIPFSERTITTAQDAAALKDLSGTDSLPVLTIGAQTLKGYSDQEWTQYLDAAGYPKTSQLPRGYRNPPATALAPAKPPELPTETRSPQIRESEPAPPPAAAPANPAGIRF